jgi:23S rRNA (cytidine1920-2'-O)/16S rRNA (cytidine1409-2'-O)-methyltransferase
MAKSLRLDLTLVERGLAPTREKAQRAILAGQVWVNGHRNDKASSAIPSSALVEVRGTEKFVSRSGHKLEGALLHFEIKPQGWKCLDIGASTGGFTDCLLQHGAEHVTALDVGHGQLDWKIRSDPRVRVIEHYNARNLQPADVNAPFQLVVVDVSFISLRLILPALFPVVAPEGGICALIKPQFEAGKDLVGKGGIVREESVRQGVIDGLTEWLKSTAFRTMGVMPSTLPGTEGNQEYLWWIKPA